MANLHWRQGIVFQRQELIQVDVKIYEIERVCGGDVEKMKYILRDNYGIDLT